MHVFFKTDCYAELINLFIVCFGMDGKPVVMYIGGNWGRQGGEG